jgi:hypothetical protein
MSIINTTNTFQRHLSRPLAYTPPQFHNRQKDNIERREILDNLKRRTQDNSHSREVTLEGIFISLEPGSSLEDTLQPARAMLRNMVEKASFKKLLMKLRLPEDSLFEVTATGQVKAHYAGKTLSFESAFKLVPELNDDLVVLVEMAQLTGGVVTLDDQVGMIQWLRFHRYLLPRTVIDAQNLITFLEQSHPDSPPFGNYWEMVTAGENNPLTMSSAQRNMLRTLIKEYTKGESLLELLSDTILGGRSTPIKRSEAEYFLNMLVSSSIALIWAKSFVRDLDWYGAQDDQPLSDESLQQILFTALLLDLHPKVGEQEPRNQVAEFDLYAAHHIEKSFASVHTEFERHLINHHRMTEQNVALASHLLLAGNAPEFLVPDLPPTLLLGTPQWVDYCRTIAVQEAILPGSSRSMTHAQIQHLMKSDSVTESQQALNALAAVDPVIDWALLNGIVTHNEVNRSVKDSLEVAVAAYARHAKTFAETAETLSRPLPTRKSVALDILKQVAKGCTYLEDDVLHQKSNRTLQDAYAKPFLISPVDLLMSNDLQTGNWDLEHGESIYKAFPKMLPNLISPDGEFYRQFNRNYVSHTQAMSTHLKLALSSLPLLDRTRLLRGQVTIFSVRPSVATLQPSIRPPIVPLLSTPLDIMPRVPMESQKDKEQATGRYGVVVCTYFEGRLRCYELFTLHGDCRENTELAELIERENLLHTSPRSSEKKHTHPAPVHQLPTDIECYTHGVIPGLVNTSRGVIEKIGELSATPPPSNIESKGYYQSFYSSEFDPLVNFVLKHRPIATYDELVKECWGQTRLEALREEREEREEGLNTFLNIVVPFKSCIEDISSDDPDRQVQGVVACTLEAAMTLLLVVGVIAKVASLAVSSMTLATKASAMAKTGLSLVSSLLNPLDGVPDLLIGGAKLLRKGFKGSVAALENAISDLRQLTGQPQFKQLAKAVDPDIIRLGTWRPVESSKDLFQVWGIRHNDHWYALNRQGEPWGAKLNNFEPTNVWHLLKLDKLMPASYTRKLLKDALPASRAKVDDAIRVLTDASLETDSGKVVKLLLGDNSSQGRRKFLNHLNEVKKDIEKVTPDNFILDTGKSESYAALNPDWYAEWARATPKEAAQKKFMRIYTHNFNKQFRTEGYSHDVLADDIVHELFHGAPNTLDHSYAHNPISGRQGNYQRVDVAPLINLASGHLREPGTLKVIDKANAFNNADSFALTTSLLSQLSKDPASYRLNIETMSKALERNNGYIGWEVLVKLNPV